MEERNPCLGLLPIKPAHDISVDQQCIRPTDHLSLRRIPSSPTTYLRKYLLAKVQACQSDERLDLCTLILFNRLFVAIRLVGFPAHHINTGRNGRGESQRARRPGLAHLVLSHLVLLPVNELPSEEQKHSFLSTS